MINNNIKNVRDLLSNCSIETTPNVYAKYGSFADLVSIKNNIYITYLPNEDMNKVIDTARKLKLEGYSVIPHLPARTIANHEELKNTYKLLQKIVDVQKF
jgi:hypothetical protein